MEFMFLLGILLLFTTFHMHDADKKICYESKTCIHNAVEKCGVNSAGEVRRFLDSCDMLEYNCLNEASYKKTSLTKCRSVTPLSDVDSKIQQQSDSRVESSHEENDKELEPLLNHNSTQNLIQQESSHE